MIGAAVVNGFVVPQIIPAGAIEDPQLPDRLHALLALCHATNYSLSQIGVVALSIAVLLWSCELARRKGLSRVIGGAGLLCSVVPIAVLFAGFLPMNVHGFEGFVVLQAIWYLGVGGMLIGGRV